MVSRDFRSVSKWESSNETFLAGRVGQPGIGAARLSIFPLSRPCERESRGSANNHTWIDAARTWETRRAYPRGYALIRNHCAMSHRQSNPDEPRISYVIARISPSNVQMIRAGGSEMIAALFFAKKNISRLGSDDGKKGKKNRTTINGKPRSEQRHPQI